jgi:hypothetical protein
VMSMPLFEEIIEKISPHDTIRCVTFHFSTSLHSTRFSMIVLPCSRRTVYHCGCSRMLRVLMRKGSIC